MTHPITRTAAAVLAVVLVALPGAALAQDATPPPDLAAAFPATLGGTALPVEVFAGQAWLDRQDSSSPDGQIVAQKTQALLDATGKTIDDLTVATALYEPSAGNHAAITAVQVAGASAADLVSPTIAMLLGDVANPVIAVRALGSRHVLRVSDGDQPGAYPRTVYPNGDTVWVIEAEQPVLLEIVDSLPGEPSSGPVDVAPQLVDDMPFLLGGERPSLIQVFSDWSPLLSTVPGETFGPQFEDAELRLFLQEGVTSDDLATVVGSWDTAADGSFILGFNIDGASPETMQGILDEVIAPSISLTMQQPTVSQKSIAGRDLTVVTDESAAEADRAISTYYFDVAGDTVWMVNMATADEAILNEALQALPAAS